MDDASSNERAKRSGVIIRADIDVGGVRVERRVRNLSLTGACVDSQGEFRQGQRVTVAMGRLHDLAAEVMWAKPNLAGLRFDDRIDMDAARAPRGAGKAAAGWMQEMNHAYRRRV